MNNLGLYVHVPFCANKCPYCDFYSRTDSREYGRYVDSLLLQMEDYSDAASNYTVDTVYIGGGTPTVIPDKDLLRLVDGIYENFRVFMDAETTVEANPATVTSSLLKKLKKLGVNRISFGVQSTCDNELKALGRIHDWSDACRSFGIAREAGFDNINIDLMYGIPEQTMESLRLTLERICELEPEHISLYNLKIEHGTRFDVIRDELALPDEDTEYEMYKFAIDFLKAHGYEQYEISNFAKPGYECQHNLRYWSCGEYLGLGPAAHSYFNGRRFSFKRDLESYMAAMENPEDEIDTVDENYTILPNERIGEYIMLGLRLNKGIDTVIFSKLFGLDFEKMFSDLLPAYVDSGFMTHEGTKYALTTKGMFVSNYILSSMLDFDSEAQESLCSGI
ncbi:MAG: radical SAM family heme chaperone HemW [Clostridia bacterium]|nr:radical SAM family heme chaperone HemW [Clostridia bacterium]